jgi:hypothetical protein
VTLARLPKLAKLPLFLPLDSAFIFNIFNTLRMARGLLFEELNGSVDVG